METKTCLMYLSEKRRHNTLILKVKRTEMSLSLKDISDS